MIFIKTLKNTTQIKNEELFITTNLSKKCTAQSYSFLVIDVTLASDNLFCFRENIKNNHHN